MALPRVAPQRLSSPFFMGKNPIRSNRYLCYDGVMTAKSMMSQADYARHRPVSRFCVSNWKAKGLLVLIGGKVDVVATDAVLDARPETYHGRKASAKSSAAPGKPAEPDAADWQTWSLAEATRRKEVLLVRKRELEFQIACGKLVDADAVESCMRSDYAITAQRLLQLPSTLSPRLAAMRTAGEVEAFLRKEMEKALNQLSQEADDQLRKLSH